MTRYLLDTTLVIDWLRDLPEAVRRYEQLFDKGDEALINEVVVCEAATGAPSHPDPALMTFLEPIEFIQPGPQAGIIAGEWRAAARARGQSLSLADALIAAAAHVAGATVITRNVRDFALTPVRVETY